MGLFTYMINKRMSRAQKIKKADMVSLIAATMVSAAGAYLLLTLTSITATYAHGERLILPHLALEVINTFFYALAFLGCLLWIRKNVGRLRPLIQHSLTIDIWVSIVILDSLVLSVLEGRLVLAEIFILPLITAVLIPVAFHRLRFSSR